jgi:ribosomal-protein-alanine N-acetyltransferase
MPIVGDPPAIASRDGFDTMSNVMSSPGLILRKAVVSDLDGITEVENASFVHAGERFNNNRVKYLIVNPRSTVTVAESAGRVIGWASGVVWLRGVEPWGRVYALAVHPDARGQRLGKRLLDDMIRSLRDRGAGRIFLEVRTDNAAAVRLYESAGFSPCRLLANYYGKGIAAHRMALPARP